MNIEQLIESMDDLSLEDLLKFMNDLLKLQKACEERIAWAEEGQARKEYMLEETQDDARRIAEYEGDFYIGYDELARGGVTKGREDS